MRFKPVLSVFAEPDVTGEKVELSPGGIAEEHETLDDLFVNLAAVSEQGWGDLSRRQMRAFFDRIDHQAEGVARLFASRELAGVGEPAEITRSELRPERV